MASLTNTKIKDTYDGLLKTTDNDALGGTYKLITDGLGNSSNVYLGTGGNVGIGTSSPSAKLDVNGTSIFRDQLNIDPTGDPNNVLSLNARNSNDYANLIFRNSGGSANWAELVATPNTLAFETSGSERMRLDSSGNLGIGTTSPSAKLDVDGDIKLSAGAKIKFNDDRYFTPENNVDGAEISANGIFKVKTGTTPTERFRIDSSGNVGIGTSSPAALLSLQDGSTEDVSGSKIRMELSGINPYWEIIARNGGTSANRQLGFYTSSIGSDVMTLTQSGNVGIGETPSPISGDKIITLKGTSNYATLFVKSNLVEGLFRANNTDTTLYIGTETNHPFALVTNGAERMRIDSSGNVALYETLQFFDDSSTPSASSFIHRPSSNTLALGTNSSEAMRIDSSGRLGIGTTSPQQLLSIQDTSDNAYLHCVSGTSNLGGVWVGDSDSDYVGGFLYDNGQNASYFYTNGSEKMRITSDSNPTLRLGISGTGTSVFEMKSASGGSSVIDVEQFLQIKTSGSERMRITSGGNVLVGCTSLPDASTSGFVLTGTSSGNRSSSGSSTTAYNHLLFYNGNGIVGSISTSGSATAYNTSSDYRLKENVVDLTGALDRVDQLEPKRFNFIADEDTTVDGFLAHEVQDIVPEAVTGEKDAVDDEGNPQYQGIDQSKIVPLLVGAIKELKAEIETLKSQINL